MLCFEIQRVSRLHGFHYGKTRKIRSRRVEYQSSDREANTSKIFFVQGNAIFITVSENADYVFDRNLGSELTEFSGISIEIEEFSQRLTEQDNTKKTQIEELPNSKLEVLLDKYRANKNHNSTSREDDTGS